MLGSTSRLLEEWRSSDKLGIQRKVSIPNVCRAFGIPYVDTFTLIRKLAVVL
ncbi:MAG: DUF4411 family protein [Firmicutes bacterium]|nr:DUF4411 family protein [Bacillota bacterium]